LHEGDGLYYGISWDRDFLYLGHRLGIGDPTTAGVLKLDKDYKIVSSIPGDYTDINQIFHDGSALYSVVPSRESVLKYDGQELTEYNWTGNKTDTYHLNSIWFDGANFWVCYHNFTRKMERENS